MKRTMIAAAMAGAFTVAAAATASAQAPAPALAPALVAPDPSTAEMQQRIEAKGYKNVHDLEYDDGRWEADATSPAGIEVDVYIDPTTGNIVQEDDD
jgi:hypothetical protein